MLTENQAYYEIIFILITFGTYIHSRSAVPRELYGHSGEYHLWRYCQGCLGLCRYNCISQYWAVLYDNAGAVQARQNLSAAGKADFANLSSGTYNVKLEKKDGSDTHPTALSVMVVSTYRRFSVDMTKATQTAATGECATDGKVALKIKDGSGPFVVKFYAPGATTPTFTSPATNKTGTETTVNITGLKPSTKYDIEVEDRAGGGTCSLTEPKKRA